MQTGVTSYFALNDVQDRLAAQANGLVAYRLPSFGTFSTHLQTDYYFGMPRSVRFPGVLMDIDYLYAQVADDQNNQQDVVNFMRTVGPRTSALEHLVPEELFSTAENPAHGISAVKAIALAQSEGQRIYSITSGNLEAALSAITADAALETEIRNAVNAGKEVSIHQSPISYYGWQGHGYIIIDPETGAGAYKISGGANGGLIGEIHETLSKLLNYVGLILDFIAELAKLVIGAVAGLLQEFGAGMTEAAAGLILSVALLIKDVANAALSCDGIMQLVVPVLVFSLAMIPLLFPAGLLTVLVWVPLYSIAMGYLIDKLIFEEC